MQPISQFKNLHKDETVVLIGNGMNLKLTPPEEFKDYYSIGMNTIWMYKKHTPDYYVTVDRRFMREASGEIIEKFKNGSMFLPQPKLMKYKGPNIYHFKVRPGPLWPTRKGKLVQPELDKVEVVYGNVMHMSMKLAFFMGFTQMLIIGMERKPNEADRHFWGIDPGTPPDLYVADWAKGYKILRQYFNNNGVEVLNISEKTYVPEDIIPRADWKNYL